MTAKEFLRNKKNEIGLRSQASPLGSGGIEIEVMIEFAEHRISEVKNQILKEVSNNAEYLQTLEADEFECITIENLKGILNNIK